MANANYQSTDAVDFVSDPNGQTGKAGVSFYDPNNVGTESGSILEPWNTIDEVVSNTVNSSQINDCAPDIYVVTTANRINADGKDINLTADSPGTLIVSSSEETQIFSTSSDQGGSKYRRNINGVVLEGIIDEINTEANDLYTDIENLVGYNGLDLWFSDVGSNNGSVLKSTLTGFFRLRGQIAADLNNVQISDLIATNINVTKFTGPGTACGPVISRAFIQTDWIGNYLDGYDNRGNSQLTENKATNLVFDANCQIRIRDTNGVDIITYADLTAAKSANPTWFPNSIIGERKALGDPTRGFFLLARDSDLWTVGFSSLYDRPGKLDWIIKSNTTPHSGAFTWVNDRATATGTQSVIYRVDFGTVGIKNPTVFLARGLDLSSNTPSYNTSSVNNPTILTFRHRPEVGTFKEYRYNIPIGTDAAGLSSGQTGVSNSYNPLTRVEETLTGVQEFEFTVVEGTGAANTGVYGWYIASTEENFVIKLTTSDGAFSGQTVTVGGVNYTTDSDGFIPMLDLSGSDVLVQVSITGFDPYSETLSLANDFNYYNVNLTGDISVSRTTDTRYNFFDFRRVYNASLSDLPVCDLLSLDINNSIDFIPRNYEKQSYVIPSLPGVLSGKNFFIYANLNEPINDADFDDWTVSLFKSSPTPVASNVATLIKDFIDGGPDYRFYTTDLSIPTTVAPGHYILAIYNSITESVKYQINIRVIDNAEYQLGNWTYLKYRSNFNQDNFNYEALSQFNEVLLDLSQTDSPEPEYSTKSYTSVATGETRLQRTIRKKKYTIETYYFSNEMVEACETLADTDEVFFNNKKYVKNEVHQLDDNQFLNVKKGTMVFCEEDYSTINIHGSGG